MRKLIVLILVNLFLIGIVGATIETFPNQKINTDIHLKQVGADFSSCNITSFFYKNTTLIKDVQMTKRGNEYNYTVDKGNITAIGDYIVNGFCTNGTDDIVWAYNVPVTYTGQNLEDSGTTAAIILIGVLGLAFMFLYIGFKLSVNPKLVPISFFFIILALMLGIYSLHLGWSLSHDIIQYESLSSSAGVIYITVLWLLIGIVIISMALMLIAFIKELSNVVKRKKFGDDFNPITNTYE